MRSWKAVIAAVLLTVIAFGSLIMAAAGMAYAVWTRADFVDRTLEREEAYPVFTDLLLDLMEKGLPHGRDASRLLRATLTPEWMRDHVRDVLGQASAYIHAQTDDLPVVPIRDLKELLYQSMPDDKNQQARRDEAWILLSPLPDAAVWSDFLSPEPLYAAREGISVLRTVLMVLGGCILTALGLWWALEQKIARALHWLGGALIAGAFVGILFCAAAWWVGPRLMLFWKAQQSLMGWGLSADTTGAYLKGLIKYAVLGLGLAYGGMGLAGYILMQAVPVKEDEEQRRPPLKLVVPESTQRTFMKYPL